MLWDFSIQSYQYSWCKVNILNILRGLFKKGIKIGYSSGKAFDPREQERTDPIRDMMEADKKRRKKNELEK